MSDESNQVSLRDHFDNQIRWVDRYFERRLEDAKNSIDKAEQQLNKRLEGMNEFRDTLKDQAARLATKDDLAGLDKRVQILERNQSSGEGRTSITTVLWALGASIASSVAVGLMLRFVK